VERLDRWTTAKPTDGVPPDPPAGLHIRPAGPDDAEALTPLLQGGEPVAERFARGDEALIAELHGKPVGCVWLLGGPVRMPHYLMRVGPRPGVSFTRGLYVEREARGRGIGEALTAAARDLALQRDTTLNSYVDPGNPPAVAIRRRLGYERQEGVALVIFLNRLCLRLPRPRRSPRLGRPG
jgi:GNAT superfamily N-acetyltransferase